MRGCGRNDGDRYRRWLGNRIGRGIDWLIERLVTARTPASPIRAYKLIETAMRTVQGFADGSGRRDRYRYRYRYRYSYGCGYGRWCGYGRGRHRWACAHTVDFTAAMKNPPPIFRWRSGFQGHNFGREGNCNLNWFCRCRIRCQ